MPDNSPTPAVPEPASRLYHQADDTPPPDPTPAEPVPRDDKGRFQSPKSIAPYLRRQAREFGLSDDDLKECDPDEVREIVNDRRWEARLQQVAALRTRDVGTLPEAVAAPLDEPLLSDEDYDPGLVKAFKRQAEAIRKLEARIAALEQHVGGIAKFHQQQIDQGRELSAKKLDGSLSRYPHLFGEGRLKDIGEGSPEWHARKMADAFLVREGATFDNVDQLVDKLVNERLGGKPKRQQDPDPDELDEDETDRLYRAGAGVYAKPTSRGGVPDPPGREKAIQAAKQSLNGLKVGAPTKTDMNEFRRQ